MSEGDRCETCRFHTRGRCYRYPPQVIVWPAHPPPFDSNASVDSAWPHVSPVDLCGEFKPRKRSWLGK